MIALKPRSKILLYVLLVLSTFLFDSFSILLLLLFIVMVLVSRIPWAILKKGIVPVVVFLVFTFISNVLFHGGEAAFEFLGVRMTHEGLFKGGRLTLRIVILVLGAKVLTASTRPEDLIEGMRDALGPVGRWDFVRELLVTASLTLSLLPIIYDEALALYQDVKNSDGNGIRGKIRLAVSLLTPLFERSLKRAKEIAETGRMNGRGSDS